MWSSARRDNSAATGADVALCWLRTRNRRDPEALIRLEREDNRRHRRLSEDEEKRLLEHAPAHIRPMIIAALDTGMRRGEMLALPFCDIDAILQVFVLRGTTTKS